MKKILSILLCTLTVQSFAENRSLGTAEPSEIIYMDRAYIGSPRWDNNWFIQAQAGKLAFLGTPSGCGDMMDRTAFLAHFAIGKWITPTAGIRLSFEGFRYKDTELEYQNFKNIHADFLYNLTNLFREDYSTLPKWNVSPLAGLGLIENSYGKPFALTLGLNISYRLSERISLSAEIANTLTWEDFDGIGERERLGDNLAQLSIGLTYTIGKKGWKPVAECEPLIMQCRELQKNNEEYKNENKELKSVIDKNKITFDGIKTILKKERLLDKYAAMLEEGNINIKNPKNNYSGLLSLRKRLREKNQLHQEKDTLANTDEKYLWSREQPDTILDETDFMIADETANNDVQYYICTPMYFFFQKGVSSSIEDAQTINIREIAKAMAKYSLKAKISGAADSMTGNAAINEKLGIERATYIAKRLNALGISHKDIETEGRGGINVYDPMPANRNVCVRLYPKQEQ